MPSSHSQSRRKSVKLLQKLMHSILVSPSHRVFSVYTKELKTDRRTASTLHGRLISVKDNIASLPLSTEATTCASKALDNYVSPCASTVATLLNGAGAVVAGKTNMDEFGMGSHSQPPHTGAVTSHLRTADSAAPLSAGGSSGGSAVAVATHQCFAALGTDTGGSVRLPAAWTGSVGFKPSYGRLSRWGVVDYANSLDTVGVLTRTVADTSKVFQVLDHHDSQDPTSVSPSTRQRFPSSASPGKKLRIGVPIHWNLAGLQPQIREAWTSALSAFRERGHNLVPVHLPSTPLALSAYYILAPAEASSNLARYDGVRYGSRASGPDARETSDDETSVPLYATTRAAGLGPEVRRRILLGSYSLSAEAMDNYFIAAQRVRRAVQRDFDRAFKLANPLRDGPGVEGEEGVDVLLGPTAPTLPPRLEEIGRMSAVEGYVADALTVPASLAGLPAVSVPVRVPGLERRVGDDGVDEVVWSAGMQVVGQYGDDEGVLEVARLVEEIGLA